MRVRHANQPDGGTGLSESELNQLGTYNAERYRGVAHTAQWQEQMAVLQARFDEAGSVGWEEFPEPPVT